MPSQTGRKGEPSRTFRQGLGGICICALVAVFQFQVIRDEFIDRKEPFLDDAPNTVRDKISNDYQGINIDQKNSVGKIHDDPTASTVGAVSSFRLPLKERIITLIHVGKAGAMTIRLATSLACRLLKKKNNTPERMEQCIRRKLPLHAPLAHAVQCYAHMHAYNQTELEQSTSFLFSLRNPVDRVISNWKYSHPVNCQGQNAKKIIRPWGCEAKKNWIIPTKAEYRLYTLCFPSAAMEPLAQSVTSPYYDDSFAGASHTNDNHSDHTIQRRHDNLTLSQKQQCRWIARQFIQGQWATRPAPHMYYKYEYYRNITILQDFAHEKEILGVRTEYEWEDLKALDIAMGGHGVFRREGRIISHGSEHYQPSPLSTEAYHKLCCVLEREISFYEDIVQRVLNFNDTVKQECMNDVKRKCGIETSWDEWRLSCRQRLEADQKLLEPYANNTRFKGSRKEKL